MSFNHHSYTYIVSVALDHFLLPFLRYLGCIRFQMVPSSTALEDGDSQVSHAIHRFRLSMVTRTHVLQIFLRHWKCLL